MVASVPSLQAFSVKHMQTLQLMDFLISSHLFQTYGTRTHKSAMSCTWVMAEEDARLSHQKDCSGAAWTNCAFAFVIGYIWANVVVGKSPSTLPI